MNAPPEWAKTRSRIVQAVRTYFHERGFVEVETPVLIPTPALERHIDAEHAGNGYLRTSPELHMKRLLATGDGYSRIFQMGACFRRGERGRLHNPEYTMLEWYRADADYLDVLSDAKGLIAYVAEHALGTTRIAYQGQPIELMPVWDCLSVREAFVQFAGWDVLAHWDADRFEVDWVERVEPRLNGDRPVVLRDFPAPHAALAALSASDPRLAERWELYIGGLELANAFTELTNPAEQRRRFEECARFREQDGKEVYPMDEPFLQALERGLPPCAGVALGIDRLVMLFTDAWSIDDVRLFCE